MQDQGQPVRGRGATRPRARGLAKRPVLKLSPARLPTLGGKAVIAGGLGTPHCPAQPKRGHRNPPGFRLSFLDILWSWGVCYLQPVLSKEQVWW